MSDNDDNNASSRLPWRRVGIEALAIVASILLAFGIDAWWDGRQESTSDLKQLSAVLDELYVHKRLMAEAIDAHLGTIEEGKELLAIMAAPPGSTSDADIARLMARFVNFYQINTPFGALNTAFQSGAISRMEDSALASALASWPVAIDDLLEEQNLGTETVTGMLSVLSGKMPLNTVLREVIDAPTIMGIDEAIPGAAVRLAPSPHATDFERLYSDPEVENNVLRVIVMAQSSYAEATVFDDRLDALIAKLSACLDAGRC